MRLPTWGETQGAYRLLSNGSISYREILMPHWSQIYHEATQYPRTLLLADTTEFDFTTHQARVWAGAGWQQQREYRLQSAYGAGDESADAADLGVDDLGALHAQARPSS